MRVTQKDRIFFRIPRDQLHPGSLKRLLRIERYNEYKLNLSAEAKRKDFTIPAWGLCITFYIPVPPSWSKKQKKLHHGILHQRKPDLKNLLSAFEDGLTSEDKYIAHYGEMCKRWVDSENGWIELSFLTHAEMRTNPFKNDPD